jgi:hypothetical protein
MVCGNGAAGIRPLGVNGGQTQGACGNGVCSDNQQGQTKAERGSFHWDPPPSYGTNPCAVTRFLRENRLKKAKKRHERFFVRAGRPVTQLINSSEPGVYLIFLRLWSIPFTLSDAQIKSEVQFNFQNIRLPVSTK